MPNEMFMFVGGRWHPHRFEVVHRVNNALLVVRPPQLGAALQVEIGNHVDNAGMVRALVSLEFLAEGVLELTKR